MEASTKLSLVKCTKYEWYSHVRAVITNTILATIPLEKNETMKTTMIRQKNSIQITNRQQALDINDRLCDKRARLGLDLTWTRYGRPYHPMSNFFRST